MLPHNGLTVNANRNHLFQSYQTFTGHPENVMKFATSI